MYLSALYFGSINTNILISSPNKPITIRGDIDTYKWEKLTQTDNRPIGIAIAHLKLNLALVSFIQDK